MSESEIQMTARREALREENFPALQDLRGAVKVFLRKRQLLGPVLATSIDSFAADLDAAIEDCETA